MAVPEADMKVIDAYCARKVPAHLSDEIRVEARRRGASVTIVERRPPWREGDEEWTSTPVVRLRYETKTGLWHVRWFDRNGESHPFDDEVPPADIAAVLAVVDLDPTGIFWG